MSSICNTIRSILLILFVCLIGLLNSEAAHALNTGAYGYPPGTEQPNVNTSSYPTGFAAGSAVEVITSGHPIPALSSNRGGLARFFMKSSGISQNDIVVNPNCKNCAHAHWFWGNKEVITNARKDPLKLLENCVSTNRGGAANCSAYWSPAMVDISDGSVQPYGELTAYYKVAPKTLDWLQAQTPPKKAEVPPLGLRYVSGQASNSIGYSTNEALNGLVPRMVYGCTDANNVSLATQQTSIPACPQGGTVHVFIKSPHCWDGVNVTSSDFFSHMAMTLSDDTCPASHPVVVSTPESYGWKIAVTKPEGTLNWMLASDNYPKNGYNGGRSGHIDWVNGWKPEIHQAFTDHCINERRDSSNALCDGRRLGQVN